MDHSRDRGLDASEQPPRVELSKPEILRLALALADEHGLDAVTIRRIADAAGLTPMSLYRHIRTKTEILDALGELAWEYLAYRGPRELPWSEELFEIFRHVHRALIEHPGLIDILLLKPTTSRTALRALERMLGILHAAGFTPDAALLAVVSLESYTMGFAVQQRMRRGRDGLAADDGPEASSAEAFPNVAATGVDPWAWTSDEWFWAGLRRQITALVRELAAEPADPARSLTDETAPAAS